MTEQYLIIIGSLIILVLGSMHLYYALFTEKFQPRQAATLEMMKTDYPRLTRKTTIWNSLMGFHMSHSYGAMFIGIINIGLAINHFEFFQTSPFLFLLNVFTATLYVHLAIKHWFRIPLIGTSLTLICYVLAFVITLWRD